MLNEAFNLTYPLEKTMTSSPLKVNNKHDVEDVLWSMLKIDEIDREMKSGELSPSNQVVMGTGRTENACEMCTNSVNTSGCGGC